MFTVARSVRLPLRTRVTLLFVLVGLVTSLALSLVSFLVARSYLLERRDDVVERQAVTNAELVRSQLASRRSEAFELISTTRTEQGGFAVLHLGREDLFFSQDLRFTQGAFPAELLRSTIDGVSSYQRFSLGDDAFIAIGIAMPSVDAAYFEAFPVGDEQRAITVIGSALVIGTLVIGLISGLVGWAVSRRLMRPLVRVTEAAGAIAAGGLDVRLESEGDPDLSTLVTAFNDMADAVQSRIERETRFASDVSHELRSPITALAAAVEVLDARRADLPDRTQQALDVVSSQVRRFDQMVLDLLELSRLDVGITDLHREDIDLAPFIARIAQRYGSTDVRVEVAPDCSGVVNADKRRLERIVANLLDNARLHGGGATRVTIERFASASGPAHVRLGVEDSGPGVSPSERARIFERFARGSAGRSRAGGTGLGLALVAEHARSHGGLAWVEDSPSGGARFVVQLPEGGRT